MFGYPKTRWIHRRFTRIKLMLSKLFFRNYAYSRRILVQKDRGGLFHDVRQAMDSVLLAQAVNTNEQISITEMKHEDALDMTVARNVNAWINYIVGSQMGVTAEETEKDKEARFVYSVRNKESEKQRLSPLNMSFGNSFVLPIVLAVLTAPEYSIIRERVDN